MDPENDNETPNANDPTPRKFGLSMRLIFRITGVDEETMLKCPKHDVDNVRALSMMWTCRCFLSLWENRIA